MTMSFFYRIKKYALFTFFLFVIMLLSFGKNYTYAVKDGISLWACTILPSVFPYFFLTAVMNKLNVMGGISKALNPVTYRLYKTRGITGYAFMVSALCGYPSGSKWSPTFILTVLLLFPME